jgi:hypothetical protein
VTVRAAYLVAAESALHLLRRPEVAVNWAAPSALAEFSVGGLAAHLAHQVLSVPALLDGPAPADDPIALLDHYSRVSWVGADVSSETNVGIRKHADGLAGVGPDELIARLAATIEDLRGALVAESADRMVPTPSGPWSLRLDDFLVTRMMEIAVHSDDLAVSTGVPTPELPAEVLEPVLALLTGLAVRRHGQPAVLRALSRAERAPDRINAR